MAVTTDGQPDYVEPVILHPLDQVGQLCVAQAIGQPAFATKDVIDHDGAKAVLFANTDQLEAMRTAPPFSKLASLIGPS